VPIDRAATLRQAEKLLRQGKLDQAIAEYVRLVEDQPRDWNTANLLGDVYVRAGQLDQAIEQFSRTAENLTREGFLPRASALYKKILKLKPDADQALVQAGELAAQQGLLADARTFFTTAAQNRRRRGDTRGALQVTVRLGSLDKSDVDARLAAAQARVDLDDLPGALQALHEVATMLIIEQREADAIGPLSKIVEIDPGNAQAKKELARVLMAQGRDAEAGALLTRDIVGNDTGLLIVAAETRLRQGDIVAGLEMIDAMLASADIPVDRVTDLALSLTGRQPAAAYAIVDKLTGTAIAASRWTEAADLLTRFVSAAPHHVDALTRLVDVCVDAGLNDRIVDAQVLLVDAYLEAGAAAQARYVAEDLVSRQPWDRAHYARLRAALEAGGETDPDRALADWLAEAQALGMQADVFEDQPVQVFEDQPVQEVVSSVEPVPASAVDSSEGAEIVESTGAEVVSQSAVDDLVASPSDAPQMARPEAAGLTPQTVSPRDQQPVTRSRLARNNPHAIDLELIFGRPEPKPVASAIELPAGKVEEDLSVALDQFLLTPTAPPQAPGKTADPADIEKVFANLRDEAAQRSPDESADQAYSRGAALLEAGEIESSIEQLRAAARSPRRRFAAASLLARAYQHQKKTAEAIEWLGHAVDAPAASREERFDALFRLADLLESVGEPESALAACLELQADAGDYRDVAVRIARLSRAGSGG
jgi:tetratricopeptide (TPR) repeat protein